MRPFILFSTALLLSATAVDLAAQRAGSAAEAARAQEEEGERPNRFDVQLHGGVTTYVNRLHASAGGVFRYHRGAWSALALGSLGTGADYESRMYGGGVGRSVARAGPFALSVFGGLAYYEDVGWTGIDRAAAGPILGAVADVPVGPLLVSFMLTDFFGRYSGDDTTEPFTFYVPRLMVAVGL